MNSLYLSISSRKLVLLALECEYWYIIFANDLLHIFIIISQLPSII